MSARYYCESFLITHLCLVLSSAKKRSLPVLLYSLACLKPPACYGKQMLSRLYYFSKHSYPLPCYFLWSARLAALTSPSPPLLVSATLTPASRPPHAPNPQSSLPATRDGPARPVHGGYGCSKFRSSVMRRGGGQTTEILHNSLLSRLRINSTFVSSLLNKTFSAIL